MGHAVVRIVVRVVRVVIVILVVVLLITLPAGSLRRPPVEVAEELASVGSMRLVAVKGHKILEAILLLVMVRVLQDNTGTALLV